MPDIRDEVPRWTFEQIHLCHDLPLRDQIAVQTAIGLRIQLPYQDTADILRRSFEFADALVERMTAENALLHAEMLEKLNKLKGPQR